MIRRAIARSCLAGFPVLGAPGLAANEEESTQEGSPRDSNTTRLFRVNHADPDAIQNVLSVYGVVAKWDKTLEVLAVLGRRSQLEAVAAALAELDVPHAARAQNGRRFRCASDWRALCLARVPRVTSCCATHCRRNARYISVCLVWASRDLYATSLPRG